MEVDVLSNRLRNIKQSYKNTENKALKGRLFSENKNNTDKINFSNLLVEITKRILNENKFESNLFFH